jgi:2'-5' RNA ligase
VTLRFLGDVDDVAPITAELERRLAGAAPATAVTARRARRFGASAIGVPVAGLDELAGAVGGRQPFKGHLTLARCRGQVPSAAMATGLPVLEWPVGEVALVRSHLDRAGARYETLRVFPLSGR